VTATECAALFIAACLFLPTPFLAFLAPEMLIAWLGFVSCVLLMLSVLDPTSATDTDENPETRQ
jgi:hypothetical protein